MYRDIFTNRWILGSLGFLIVFAGACYFWYQYETVPLRQQIAELNKRTDPSEKQQTAETAQAVDAPVDSNTPTAEKLITKSPGAKTNTSTDEITNPVTAYAQETDNTEEVRVSPHGFGPYPEVPEDMPYRHHHTSWEDDSPSSELMSRVLIKLWTEGERNFIGGSTYKGNIQPHYNDAVYVHWYEYLDSSGELVRKPTGIKSGPHVHATFADVMNPPPELRVLDIETSGINPYEYLDLPSKKGEK